MPVTINANKVVLDTPIYMRVQESASFAAFYEVQMIKRTFDTSLKHLTENDEIIVKRVDTDEEIRITRHKKVPQLVVDGTIHRVTFMEIDDETRQMKKLSDECIKLRIEEEQAAERRKQIQQQAAQAGRRPSSTAGLPKIDKIKLRAEAAAKRVRTMTQDLEKTKEKLEGLKDTLVELGYTVEYVDGELKITKNEPEAKTTESETSAPEIEGIVGHNPETAAEAAETLDDGFEVDIPA